jgi:lysophospholipase L1-like esterase
MKNSTAKSTAILTCYLLVAFALSANAAIVQTTQYGNGSTAFDGAITTNLIQAGQNSLASVSVSHAPSLSPTFTTTGLNDGNAAADANLTYYGATDGTMPVTVTFNLNTDTSTGGSANGYDLYSIQAISGWTDSNLANQNFQLMLSLNGGPFNNYSTFSATTAINGGGNSILNTLTGSLGPIARGVTAVQFIFSNPGGNQAGSGGTVLHELQVFGIPSTSSSQPPPYRIAAVGDSITAGYTDNPSWAVPFEFGYRSGLMALLASSGMPFQFVGQSTEPWSGTDGTVTNIPDPDLRIAGQDHCEGYSGQNTAFIEGNIGAWLAVDQPDVILLMIGINDIGEGSTGEPTGAEQNLSNIVATVVSQSPNTRLIVAQITPYSSYTDAITRYDNYIANTLVPDFAAQGKHVTTVNQYTNMCVPGTTNIDPTVYANGINHPTAVAYARIAQTWFAGIQALALPPAPSQFINQRQLNANLVVNGGFEVPIVPVNTHNVNPAGGYWVFTSGVSGAGSGIDQGNAYGMGGANSFDGVQRACIQSSGNGSVTHISQAVSGFTVGQYYQLAFRAEGIAAFSGANPFHVSLITGYTTNMLFGGADITPATGTYTLYSSAPFQATKTVMTLDFADDGLGVVTYVSWIDSVAIYPVPGNNLVINGGFEAPVETANSHNVAPASVGWTYTSGVSGAGAGIDNDNAYGSGGSIAFEGVQRGCVQSSGNGSVTHLSQVVSNFIIGQYYQLSFAAAGIASFSGANPFHVSLISGSKTNMLFGGGDLVPNTSGYTLYTSAPFQAESPVMTLDFADDGLSVVTHVSWIDDVSIYTLPVNISGQMNNSGQFQVQFIGDTNLSYTVLGTTNLALPLSAWSVLGPAAYQSGNYFLYTDATATNAPQRFYSVQIP